MKRILYLAPLFHSLKNCSAGLRISASVSELPIGFCCGILSKAQRFDRISAAAAQILCAAGNARVAALASDAGLSMRQFERCFMQQVGVHPKLYARIVRFEAALDRKARSSTKSWTDVAHEFGYYDQMHMVHDFESLSGGTPTKILNEVEVVFRGEIEAIRSGLHSPNADGDLQ